MAHTKAQLRDSLIVFDELPDSALVSVTLLAAHDNVSLSTVWRGIKAGLYPEPIRMSAGITRWRVGDLRERDRQLAEHRTFTAAQTASGATKRPPGRPRKIPLLGVGVNSARRSPGRPRKAEKQTASA